MHKKSIFIAVFVFIFFSKNMFSQENIYQQYLDINNIPIIIDANENNFYIDDSIIVNEFFEFIDFVILRIEIIADNILNAKTTRTNIGGPYKRKFIRIIDGEINITEDTSQPRLIYDPLHPDSIKNGSRKGYVEFPNIDIVTEMVDLIVSSRILDAILSKGVDNQIIDEDEYGQIIKRVEIIKNGIIDTIFNDNE
jgi:flagellar basal-body rod protein FlgC